MGSLSDWAGKMRGGVYIVQIMDMSIGGWWVNQGLSL